MCTALVAGREAPAGRGVIENRHSADVEYPPPSPHVCMSVHPEGKKCSDLGPRACSQRPCLRVVSGQQLVVVRESADQVGVLLFNSADHEAGAYTRSHFRST